MYLSLVNNLDPWINHCLEQYKNFVGHCTSPTDLQNDPYKLGMQIILTHRFEM